MSTAGASSTNEDTPRAKGDVTAGRGDTRGARAGARRSGTEVRGPTGDTRSAKPTSGAARAGTRGARKQRTRHRLLQAAQELVAEKGFASVSVMDIAERAGLSTGAIYSNFRSKEALLLELIELRSSEAMGDPAVYPPPDQPDKPAADHLVDVAVQAGRFADTQESRQLMVLQIELFLLAVRDAALRADLAAQDAALAAELAQVLDQVGHITAPRPAPPSQQVAEVLMACIQGLQQHRLLSPTLVPDELFAWTVRALLSAARH